MKLTLILLLSLLFISNMDAQPLDTAFWEYPVNTPPHSGIIDVEEYQKGYLVLMFTYGTSTNFQYVYRLMHVDEAGELLWQMENLTTGSGLFTAPNIEVWGDNVFLTATVRNGNEPSFFTSLYLDDKAMQLSIIDSFTLPPQQFVEFHEFIRLKHDSDKRVLVSSVSDLTSVQFNLMVEMDKSGHFTKSLELSELPPRRIIDFQEIMADSLFFAAVWTGPYNYVFNKKGEVVDTVYNKVEVEFGGTTTNIITQSNGGVLSGKKLLMGAQHDYGFGLSSPFELHMQVVSADTNLDFEIREVYPLLPEDHGLDFYFIVQTVVDDENNLYIIGSELYNPFNGAVDTGSMIITKVSPSGEVIWQEPFNNGTEFELFDAFFDSNGNLLIAGSYWGNSVPIVRRNFILKFGTDGTSSLLTPDALNSSQILSMFPNPCGSQVNIQSAISGQVLIYDNAGQLVVGPLLFDKQEAQEVSVGHLPTGTYHVQFRDNQGRGYTQSLIKR